MIFIKVGHSKTPRTVSFLVMSSSTRKIGDHEVSVIGFGAMVLAGAYGTAGEEEERFKVRCRQHRGAAHGHY